MSKFNLLFVCLLLATSAMAKDTFVEMDVNIDDAARNYLISNKAAGEADMDYRTLAVLEDDLGQVHVRMQPVLNGHPVYGEQIIVHLWSGSRQLISIDGQVKETESMTQKAHMDPMKGVDRFLQRNSNGDFKLMEDPELAYVVTDRQETVFTYKVHVSYENEVGPQRDLLFVGVADGKLIARHPQIYYSRDRRTYDANNGTSLPGTLRRSETSAATGDSCLDNAHNYAGDTYDYYSSAHGRDSLDGNGMTLISTVHYQTNYNNAFWNSSQMVYGDGDGTTFSCLSGDLDVVAHELTHGVTEKTAGLIYSNESGALNEATSDIMAAAVENANGASTTDTWLLGEDIYTPNGSSTDALRYMSNPTQDGSSKDYYPERYTGSQDNGGVHWNSGIANLFFYLLVEGGNHPRGKTTNTVSGIGMTKAAKIWYRSLTVYFNSSTNFSGARSATLSSASDLYGASSNEYTQVCNAWTAVGVGSTCSGGGGGGGGGTGGELTNGTAVTGNSGSTGAWQHFYIDVPSGASNLVMSISGGSGDADLYTKFGAEPTSSSYDCRPYKSGNSESCTVATPNAGRYYVSVYAYSTYSSVSVTASFDTSGGGGTCGNSGSASAITANSGSWKYYTFDVDACATNLSVSISGGSGDADLYLRYGANPTTSTYSCRPYKNGNNESCSINNPTAGTWHIGIRAYSTFSNVTLNVSYE